MNSKGVTLVELLVVVAIIGILSPLMGTLFVGLNRTIARAQKLTASQQNTSIKFAPTNTNATGIVIVCFDNGKAMGCDEQHLCYFDNGWHRGNGLCGDGVLLK